MKKPFRTIENVNIYGNSHWIPLVYGFELTEQEKKEFDYLDNIEDDFRGFRYKGNVYCLDEFMRTEKISPFFEIFDGVHPDSYFSGIGIRFSNDGEAVKAYTFIS